MPNVLDSSMPDSRIIPYGARNELFGHERNSPLLLRKCTSANISFIIHKKELSTKECILFAKNVLKKSEESTLKPEESQRNLVV